ncbi:MAG: cytochrome b5 domain-containing protein [Elusimicrobiales bacterium]|nr:cytochrome b5 domain-containing protein [Elusimicrobiales bacterium]
MKNICVLALMVLLSGSAGAAEKAPAPETDAWKNKVFTAEELKKYNGQDGQPVYAAVDGVVYDLTKSKYWKTGTHMKQHAAGEDLSKAIHERAPKSIHRDGKILERMPKVGVLQGYAAPATAEKSAPLAAPHKVASEEVGRQASCPVTGKKFAVAETTPALDLKGRTYYFSDELSLEKFKKNPGKYLGGLKDNAKGLLKKKKG